MQSFWVNNSAPEYWKSFRAVVSPFNLSTDDTYITVAMQRSRRFWFRLHRDPGEMCTLLLWAIAALTLCVGVLSFVAKSRVREILDSWLNIHVLFSLLLVSFCLMRLLARRLLAPLRAPDICEFSRVLSRTIYVFIYAVIGLHQILSAAGHIFYGEPVDFNLAAEAQRGPDMGSFDLHNDFQAFITSGLVVLVFVRLLMYRMWLRVSDEQSVVTLSPQSKSPPCALARTSK